MSNGYLWRRDPMAVGRLLVIGVVLALAAALLAPLSPERAASAQEEERATTAQAENGNIEDVSLELLAHHDLASPGLDGEVKPRGQNGDVAVLDDTAYVAAGPIFHGSHWSSGRICTDHGGVKAVDLGDPENPDLVSTITIEDPDGVGAPWPTDHPRRGQQYVNVSGVASAVHATSIDTPAFTGDLLAIAIQKCEPSFFFGGRVEFWDVTDPSDPSRVGTFDPAEIDNPDPPPETGQWGVFEDVHIVERGDQVLALITTPFSIGNAHDASPFGDLRLVDITDVTAPEQVEVFPEVSLGQDSVQGCRTFQSGRAVAPTPDGDGAILSWYDGTQAFSSPERPESAALFHIENFDDWPHHTEDTQFDPMPDYWGYQPNPEIEGNAADVQPFTGPDGELLVMVSEDDLDPALTQVTIDAPAHAEDDFRGCSSAVTTKPYMLPDQEVSGEVAYVGRACNPFEAPGDPDPLLADPDGKIALIDTGGSPFAGCSGVEKAQAAIDAGAIAIMLNGRVEHINSPNSGPHGGIPQVPFMTIQGGGVEAMQYVADPLPSAFCSFAPQEEFCTADPTWERSSDTNVTIESREGLVSGFGQFVSVADATDREARGETAEGSRFAVVAGESYDASVHLEVETHTAGAFEAAVDWFDDAGDLIESDVLASVDEEIGRTRFSDTVQPPPGATHGGMRFEWTGTEPDGSARADGFAFSPAALEVTIADEEGEWGAQRLIDFSADEPVERGVYRSPTSQEWPPPDDGIYMPRQARMAGDSLAFTSWMSDGLRVVDVSDPDAPTEVASFVPDAVDDPAPEAGAGDGYTRDQVWPDATLVTGVGVIERNEDEGLVVVSDINAGLYVLEYSVQRTDPLMTRLSGPDRVRTANAVSQEAFADGEAGGVVLARSTDFADALAGAPLAAANNAPALLTGPDELDDRTAAELQRVASTDETVWLLGGTAALSESVADAVESLGYSTERLGGSTRVETSLEVAEALGDPDQLLVTTGEDFPDAVAAGAAAAHTAGAVLLTSSEDPHPAVTEYLNGREGVQVSAVGGPAARAHPDADPVFGSTREATAVAVAETFFDQPTLVGLARHDDYPDALTGGAHMGQVGGPMLLTPTGQLHDEPSGYLCANTATLSGGFVYGGTQAVAESTLMTASDRLVGTGC